MEHRAGHTASTVQGRVAVSDAIPAIDEFEAAARGLGDVITHTPTLPSRALSDVLGAPVLLKMENLQRTGSFKIRGATHRLQQLTAEERARGVVAASAGNHAQGVALAAQALGISATIFMPNGVPVPKLLATRGYGAEVVLEGDTVATSLRLAAEYADRTGAILIHPFDHRDVVIGQGTLGLEIVQDAPQVDTIVTAVGGGGLISGVAAAAKQAAERNGRAVRIIGVQAENAAAMPLSMVAGYPIEIETRPTIADGILVARPGDVPFAIARELVDEVVTVTDDDIARAIVLLLEQSKIVAEPAGAAPAAAILAGKIANPGTTVAVVSGGNIDPLLLQRVVSHGLAASGRYLTIRIPLPDRPGQLARVSELIAEAGANVIEAMHTRHGHGLQISDVILELSVETRGPEHSEHTLGTLRQAGFEPVVVLD